MMKREDLEKMASILGGLLIGRTSARGLAARSGIHEGDIILATNGVATPDLPSFIRARQLRTDGVTLNVYRFGRELTLNVAFADEAPRSEAKLRHPERRATGSVAAERSS